jgi:hypothetical protein
MADGLCVIENSTLSLARPELTPSSADNLPSFPNLRVTKILLYATTSSARCPQ